MPGFANFRLRIFKRKPQFDNEGSVYRIMWRRFLRNGLNVFFLVILGIISLIAVAGYLITPDPTPYANRQHLELALQKPGFDVRFLKIKKNNPAGKNGFFKKMIWGNPDDSDLIPVFDYQITGDTVIAELFTGSSPNNGMIVSYHIIDVIASVSGKSKIECINGTYQYSDVSGEIVQISENQAVELLKAKHFVTKNYILGTDRFGRDVLSQLIIGARVSLAVGFISVFISLLVGVTLGAAAGFFGGRTDRLIVWLINVVWAIPTLFLVIAITFALGKGFWQIFIAVGLTLWVEIARLVRGLVMSVKNREYVEAARALGYSNSRIIINHILPATLGPVIVVSAANFASAILIESGLSFLGIGIQPPMPSWGTMLRENYGFLIMDYAYLAIIPGLAIMILVLTFMVIGNGIRDAMEVRGE
jgi:peptide/nickel transport system permease protein